MVLFKLFGGKKKKQEQAPVQPQNTLAEDIVTGADWVAGALRSSGYAADFTLESLREVDRFFDDMVDDEAHAPRPDGILAKPFGSKIFSLAAYVGTVLIQECGGQWITDDNDPQGEVNISVQLASGAVLFPVHKLLKRIQNGKEDAIYPYALCAMDGGVRLAMDSLAGSPENAEFAMQVAAAWKGRFPAIVQHLLADEGFSACYPGETADSLTAALGQPTVRILKGRSGMISFLEHTLDAVHIIDIEFNGVLEELFEVSVDG